MLLGEPQEKKKSAQVASDDASIPAAITDTGCERELNEDRYAVIESPSGIAWLVCDGMGGQTGGELAAQLAIDAIRRDLEKYQVRPVDVALKSALFEANRIIVLRRQNQSFASMGTTVVAVMFDGAEVVVGHIGDSRAYLVRDGAIQQLTTDHTYVQQLVERGEITAEDALAHPQAHILTRCVGAEPGVEIDLKRLWAWPMPDDEPSDSLVLCTDGLYSLVSDGEIASIVSRNTPQTACVRLVELAKARGGYDNITISVVPLVGQLKQTPPEGYEERKEKRARKNKAAAKGSGFSRSKSLLIMLTLAAGAALLTIVVFLLLKFVWGVGL